MPRNATNLPPNELSHSDRENKHRQLHTDLAAVTDVVRELANLHGLDVILGICARLAIDREASYRAVRTFTGKDKD